MATVTFGLMGAALGSAFGPLGTQLGFSIGTLIGGSLEARRQQPQSLPPLAGTGSSYGITIPVVWGTTKLGGNVIFKSDLKERSRSTGSKTPRVNYYSVDVGVLWCEGPLTEIVRIWAGDVVIFDLEAVPPIVPDNLTNYTGSATQTKDATMAAALGAANTPAYRNRAYTVINDLDLSPYGNQMPNFRALVRRSGTGSLAFDDFNRPDSNVGTSSSGHTWQFDSFHGQIQGQKAFTTGSPGAPNWIECGRADVQVQCTQDWADPDPVVGSGYLVFRLSDEDNHLLFGDEMGFGSGTYVLLKREAGTYSQLAASGLASANGDVIKVVASGSSIKCYVDGVEVISTTSTFNQSATKHGFAANGNAGIDDWSVQTVADGTAPLSQVIRETCVMAGLSEADVDVSRIETPPVDDPDRYTVRGLQLATREEARAFLNSVVPLYFVDMVEVDGTERAIPRGGDPVATLSVEDFGAVEVAPGDSESEPPVRLPGERKQDWELPWAVEVIYIDSLTYEVAHQRGFRTSKPYLDEVLTITTPLVLTAAEARRLADRFVWTAWAEQQTWEGQLLPDSMTLAPADPVTLAHEGVQYRARVEAQTMGLPGLVSLKLVAEEIEAVLQDGDGQAPVAGFVPWIIQADSRLSAWSGNAVTEADIFLPGLYWTGAPDGEASLWPGAFLYWSRDDGSSWQLLDQTDQEGTFGVTASVLAAGTSTGAWDDANSVDVTLSAGADHSPPQTKSDAEVLSGENGVRIGGEYLRFGEVASLGGGTYRLSHLLRGQRGTDAFWDEHRVGEPVTFGDGSVRRVEFDSSLAGVRVSLKLVGSGQTLDDVTAVPLTITGRELLPWSVVNVAASRDGSNNLTLTWDRRSREGGEYPWEDVPLDVETEEYQVFPMPATGTAITGITQASPAVVTAAGHGLAVGDLAYVEGVAGMLELNGGVYLVTAVSGNDVSLDVDTRDFTAWQSGGTIREPKRTITATTDSASYLASQQTTDFGSPQASILLAIFPLADDGRRGYGHVGSY